MRYRIFSTISFLVTLIIAVVLIQQAMAAETKTGEFSVVPSPALQAKGLIAISAASVEPPGGELPQVVTQMRFTAKFSELLYLRAFDAAGKEMASSTAVRVDAKTGEAIPVTFSFPKGTSISKVKRLEIIGPGLETVPPPKKKEGIGEEAKDIVKELLE